MRGSLRILQGVLTNFRKSMNISDTGTKDCSKMVGQ